MRLIDRRIGLLFALFLCLLLAAGARAAWLGGVRGGELRERAVAQQVQDLEVSGRRGTITDRNGVQLAVSEDAASVYAHPFLVRDPAGAAKRLAPLVDRPEAEIADALSERERGFVYLGRQLDAVVGRRVERLEIEGVGTLVESRRRYPHGTLAGQVLGTVGIDGDGLAGVELAHDQTLHGVDGRRRVVNDPLGDPISIVESERARAGEDVQLTIDAAIQERVEAVLRKVGETHSPRGAHALVLDPRSGDVLAMAGWPAVEPGAWSDSPGSARENDAVVSSFEPGSIFKPVTIAAALEEGVVEPRDELTLPPSIKVADRRITESSERGTERMSVGEILARSSNVGMVRIGLELGSESFDRWARAFGFDRPTGIGLPGEAPGILPAPEDYSGSSLGNLPLGQGLAATPVQMVQAYSAIAGEGVLRRPRIVAGAEPAGRRVVSKRTAAQVSQMLTGVVGRDGTAPDAAIDGYEVAGKTGTAEKADKAGGYSSTRFLASFVGFAPADDPRLLVAVMVDEPSGATHYGAEVAAPAFEEIASFALPYLRIAPK